MEQGRSSQTATLAAMLRAAHVLWDPAPHILSDKLAAGLAGFDDDAALDGALKSFEAELARVRSPSAARTWMEVSRLIITMRSRYAEDELESAIGRGVSQYVILGAGFDSLAYRRGDLEDVAKVYELDHPLTQQKKRKRLNDMGISIPKNVRFVPVDFEMEQSIMVALRSNGYQHDEPALFSWLGVVWYLSSESIDRTLGEVASSAPGSGIVVDYMLPASMLTDPCREIAQMAETAAAERGEQGGQTFQPAQMTERLRRAGFEQVEDLGSIGGNARYLAGRTDGLRIPEIVHVASGRVAIPKNLGFGSCP